MLWRYNDGLQIGYKCVLNWQRMGMGVDSGQNNSKVPATKIHINMGLYYNCTFWCNPGKNAGKNVIEVIV